MKYCRVALALAALAFPAGAYSQTFTTLVQFTGTGGTASGSGGGYCLALSGTTLYSMTAEGGANGDGSLFSVGINGTNYANLLSFTGTGGTATGIQPCGGLTVIGTRLFGMTSGGFADGDYGNVFSVGTDGTNYQNLLSFTGRGGSASGDYAQGSVTVSGTTLYGMTYEGGANGYGNIFSVGTNGANYQDVASFTGNGGTAAGTVPRGSLTLCGTTLFGMTEGGGANGEGNIFSVGINGTNFQNLVSFTGSGGMASGALPFGSLILSGTTLYGMTSQGGVRGDGNIFSIGINGTNYHDLYSFTGIGGRADFPEGSLTISGTTLYGMTRYGGVYAWGNIFSVGIDGSGYDDLYDFSVGADGGDPYGDLTLSGGTLFGMSAGGGEAGNGTVFALALPTPTPEPGTLALVGSCAVALVSYRWRRMRSRRRSVGSGRKPEIIDPRQEDGG